MGSGQHGDAQGGMEGVQIDVDVLGSREVDMAPAPKAKRRRQHDDYDYNDPFFESFEGELDAVEIECKLENFFIYRGQMCEDPKKIARRHNRELRKRKLQGAVHGAEPQASGGFDFERMLGNVVAGNSKYKKEPPFANLVFWLFSVEARALSGGLRVCAGEGRDDVVAASTLQALLATAENSPAERYADALVLSRRAAGLPVSGAPGPEEMAAYLEKTRAKTEAHYEAVAQRLRDPRNYEPDGRTYRLFREGASMVMFLRFYMLYIRFHVLRGEENVQTVRNRASEYLMASFLGTCTNNIKLKYYVRKSIEEMVRVCGESLEEVLEGRFLGDGERPGVSARPTERF